MSSGQLNTMLLGSIQTHDYPRGGELYGREPSHRWILEEIRRKFEPDSQAMETKVRKEFKNFEKRHMAWPPGGPERWLRVGTSLWIAVDSGILKRLVPQR